MPDHTEDTSLLQPEPVPETEFEARAELAQHFIRGDGLEIGALHEPLEVPPQANVTYVDRLTVEGLRREYPELAELNLIPVDIVDDGERLTSVADESQDFIVANHFLEHCEDPIGSIGTHLGKLKPGGILFYAVPDKRYTFDFRRPTTPLEHMISDHEQGPERTRRQHFEEWARLVAGGEADAHDIEASGYSIHMHVWTQAEFLELLLHCRRRFDEGFEIEAYARRSLELVAVLRKSATLPPAGPPAADPRPATNAHPTAIVEPSPVPQKQEPPELASDAPPKHPRPALATPEEHLGPAFGIPLATLRTALVGGWPAGAGWIPDERAAALRALAQPCGTAVIFPLRLTPGVRLRARVSVPPSGPLAARVQVSVRDAAGTETVLWSRIVARLGRHSVPPSVRVDVPLGTAGDADLILRAMPVVPGPRAKGSVLWREAVLDVTAPLAPPLPNRPPDPHRPPGPKRSGGAPLISFLTPVHDPPPEMLAATLTSARRQTLEAWELCLVDDGCRDPRVIEMLDRCVAEDERIRLIRRDQSGGISVATNDALRMATGEYVACLDHDDELVDDALEAVAAAIDAQPDADLLYTDEDLVLDGRPEDIALKPRWSPDLFRSTMYLCHLHVTRRSLALELGGFRPEFDGSQDYDFILRVSERAGRIVHIPRVLYHWRVHEDSVAGSQTAKPYAYEAARRAVEEHLKRTGVDGEVHFGAFPGVTRVVHRVPRGARAAVILALTGEAQNTADEVAQAANSWSVCEYRPHELVVVGPPDLIAACAERLPADRAAGRLMAIEAPRATGVAAQVNIAASAAESDYLVVLDAPVESLTRDWLARLVGFSSQPEVGAAGGKVLAADGRVENAGVLLSDGLPVPLLHGADAGRERPLGIGRIPFNLSAVSGAVVIRQETFTAFGGLDEHLGPLAVADFCLRAGESGMRIVSASDAVVRRTRRAPAVNDLAALHAFRMRWRDRLRRDPYLHPGYYSDRGDFMFRSELYGSEVSNRWRDV